jgi:hypothetical protein
MIHGVRREIIGDPGLLMAKGQRLKPVFLRASKARLAAG